MKLVIERKKWGRGYLLNRVDGKMCCLGFFAMQHCDADPKHLVGRGTPYQSPNVSWTEWLTQSELLNQFASSDCGLLMNANDNLKGEQREQRITELFAKHGVEVEFT